MHLNYRKKFIFALISCLTIGIKAGSGWKMDINREIPKHELIIKSIFPSEEMNDNDNAFIWKAGDIEIGSDGRIYVSDNRANCVHVYTLSGEWVRNFGRQGQGPGEFISPGSVSAGKKKLYVKDTGSRVQIFDYEGQYQSQFKLFQPSSGFITRDDQALIACRVYAMQSQDPSILVFDSSGKVIRSFGAPLKFAKDFNSLNLASVAIDERDSIYVAYQYYPVIRKYSKTGELQKDIVLPFDFIEKYKSENEKAFGTSRYWAIIGDIKHLQGRIYVMCLDKFVVRILQMGEDLKTEKIYEIDFARIHDDVIIRHFAVSLNDGELAFYLLEASGSRNQVYMLTPK